MALSATEQTNIMRLVVGMFNAAPGAIYFDQIATFFESSGRNMTTLANALANTGAFHQLNTAGQTADQFADSFLTPFGLQNNAEARLFITSQVNAGVNKGQIELTAVNALAASTSATFAD